MNYEVNDNDKSSTFNVALIGINSVTSAFVQSLFYHQSKKEKAPGRGSIGGYDAKSFRFSSAFTITPELYNQVGRKLSTFIYDEAICEKKIVDPVALSSIIEYQGGNPDSDSEYMGMGGQNPTLRMLPKEAKEEDDEGEDQLNVDALRTILSGYTKEGEEFNEYLKADFVLISLPAGDDIYPHFDIDQIIELLEEMELPFFIVEPTSESIPYLVESETLPVLNNRVLGQFSYSTVTRMLMEKFTSENVNIRHFFHSSKNLDSGTKRVEGYADIESYGGDSVEISFSMKFDYNLSMASSIFDIVRFLMVAKELKLAGPIKGLNVLYGSDTSIPKAQAEEECQAIADRNLMGLGQYYTPSGNYFIHK